MKIQLVLIRHSKSCSNYMRYLAGTYDYNNPLVSASQTIRDPKLSAVGVRMARAYRPILQATLREKGIDLDTAVIGSSALGRAKHTAALLFPDHPRQVMPYFTEHGDIPENTPRGGLKHEPNWKAFLKHLATFNVSQIVVVGHGNYIRDVTGLAEMKNLDAAIINGNLTPTGRLTDICITKIPHTGNINEDTPGDKCSLPSKVMARIRDMPTCRRSRKTRKYRKTRKQHGAGYNMPLAYFQNGAQFHGTTADPTGVGIGSSSASWVRAPIQQTGGGPQQGGFPPSVMGSFAANGLQYVLPVASYSGYKLFTRKNRRSGRA